MRRHANSEELAGLPGPATELGLGGMASPARQKTIASLHPDLREQADRVANRLHVDAVDWYRAQETPLFLLQAGEHPGAQVLPPPVQTSIMTSVP